MFFRRCEFRHGGIVRLGYKLTSKNRISFANNCLYTCISVENSLLLNGINT